MIKIVQWALGDDQSNTLAENKLSGLYEQGYTIVASGSGALRDTPPPKPHNPAAIAWVVLHNDDIPDHK